MTDPIHAPPESDLLPPEPTGLFSVPPPVPQKQPGFLSRLFTSRKKQQAVAIQNGYLEMVDLIRAIRSHLDRQENVQTSLLSMLEKVPDVMERQQEVMSVFKQQLEHGMENNRRLTDSMGNLNNTLASMDESQRASSRTVTDLIHRSRESEQLLREVMRRAERRMTILLIIFFLLVIGMGAYFIHWQTRTDKIPSIPTPPAMVKEQAEQPAAVPSSAAEFVMEEKPVDPPLAPVEKIKSEEFKTDPQPGAPSVETAPVAQPDLTVEPLTPAPPTDVSVEPVSTDIPASVP